MGMTKQDILNETYGLFIDMLTCFGIYNGTLKEKKQKLSFAQIMELR